MFDPTTFTRARVGWEVGILSIAAVPEGAELYDPPTLFYWYVYNDPGRPEDRWGLSEVDVRVHAITSF